MNIVQKSMLDPTSPVSQAQTALFWKFSTAASFLLLVWEKEYLLYNCFKEQIYFLWVLLPIFWECDKDEWYFEELVQGWSLNPVHSIDLIEQVECDA